MAWIGAGWSSRSLPALTYILQYLNVIKTVEFFNCTKCELTPKGVSNHPFFPRRGRISSSQRSQQFLALWDFIFVSAPVTWKIANARGSHCYITPYPYRQSAELSKTISWISIHPCKKPSEIFQRARCQKVTGSWLAALSSFISEHLMADRVLNNVLVFPQQIGSLFSG